MWTVRSGYAIRPSVEREREYEFAVLVVAGGGVEYTGVGCGVLSYPVCGVAVGIRV